jgi:uncharacterized protein (DUF58 family)
MSEKDKYPQPVFTSLDSLLRMERISRNFSLRAKRQKVSSVLGGKHASKLRGRGLDFEEVRLYAKGDDIRTIDWKVTARTGQTHTRVFSEEKEKPALIVVDQSRSMFFGSRETTKATRAAELAATLAFRVLKEGDRVGGVVFADKGVDIVPPKRDRRNILRFFERIVQRNQELLEGEELNFEMAFKEAAAKIRNIVTHDYLVVFISDFYRYSPETVRYLSIMAQHNDVVVAKIYDPMERELPEMNFIAGDENRQLNVKGQDRHIREKFATGFNSEYEDFKVKLKKHRIPTFLIDTVQPLEDQIKEYFKKSGS